MKVHIILKKLDNETSSSDLTYQFQGLYYWNVIIQANIDKSRSILSSGLKDTLFCARYFLNYGQHQSFTNRNGFIQYTKVYSSAYLCSSILLKAHLICYIMNTAREIVNQNICSLKLASSNVYLVDQNRWLIQITIRQYQSCRKRNTIPLMII